MYGLKSCNKRISGGNDKPNKGELWRVLGVVMSSLGKCWVVEVMYDYVMRFHGSLRWVRETFSGLRSYEGTCRTTTGS